MIRQTHALSALRCWANGAGAKTATAIGANIVKYSLDARAAKGAFVAANTGFKAIGRQVLVAKFAVRAQFEHGYLSFT